MGRILTLDDLYRFYVDNNQSVTFSSKINGSPIVVGINGLFATEEDDMPGMLKLKLKVCHTETNRNGSHISQANMEKAMPTLKYRPILAYIHELEDGTKDFYAHNIEIAENKDGEAEINYIEKQVGCFTADAPWLEYDEEMDKTYVMAYSVIPEEYTEAADIIRRKNGTKVSCELVINELSYNAKEKYLDLTDFYFGGCTLLGCDEEGNEIGEGMLGARADITDFCRKEPVFTYQDKMIEVLEKLNTTLSNFNKESDKKGGNVEMNKFEELLEKYGKTTEDVTFEIEGLSDEELEEKFSELFDECPESGDDVAEDKEEVVVVDNEVSDDDNGTEVDEGEESNDDVEPTFETTKKYSVDDNGNTTVVFEISHEDIRGALFNLISIYEEEDNEWYWISNVYDDYFIFENWYGDKLYKQSYTLDGDNVSLSGDRQEMFKMILTESEKLAIEKMRKDYSALVTQYNELRAFKDKYDAAELKAQKDAIFAREEYAILAEDETFKTLVSDAEQFTVEEIETKAKAIFADHVIKAGTFSAKNDNVNKSKTHGFNFTEVDEEKKAYGNLFD